MGQQIIIALLKELDQPGLIAALKADRIISESEALRMRKRDAPFKRCEANSAVQLFAQSIGCDRWYAVLLPMWTGRKFCLTRRVLGIELIEGERRARYIPEGAIVLVVGGPRPTAVRLAEVRWEDREYSVFAVI